MIVSNNQENQTRIVTTPQQSLILNPNQVNIPSSVINVELKENEEVEWIWTTYPNGQRVVTGYNIIQKKLKLCCVYLGVTGIKGNKSIPNNLPSAIISYHPVARYISV